MAIKSTQNLESREDSRVEAGSRIGSGFNLSETDDDLLQFLISLDSAEDFSSISFGLPRGGSLVHSSRTLEVWSTLTLQFVG